MIRRGRLSGELQGDFVIFLIGMRINNPWNVHKWLPVASSMPRMLKELYTRPELGFLHAEAWFGRTIIFVQYWRSIEQLLAYATNKEAEHLPAWKAFNRAINSNRSVGIWHETYAVPAGGYESIYVNMPPFGLGKAGVLHAAEGRRQSAGQRLRVKSYDD